ncbi:MAG: tetratricopeptide repeat protein [Alphaproteobacteria bacterium]
MILARATPADGFDSALSWASRGGGDGARHCAAVALIGLGQYREAAQRLERLAADLRAGDAALSLEVLAQAGQAWILAGDTVRARAVQSAALDIDPDNVELLLDRGITLATAKSYWEAIDDFNRALELAPGRPDLLTLRASAYRTLDALELARDDIDLALTRAPNNPDALLERGMLRRLAGDAAGARADWLRVIGLAEGTPSAEAARANLANLDAKVE